MRWDEILVVLVLFFGLAIYLSTGAWLPTVCILIVAGAVHYVTQERFF